MSSRQICLTTLSPRIISGDATAHTHARARIHTHARTHTTHNITTWVQRAFRFGNPRWTHSGDRRWLWSQQGEGGTGSTARRDRRTRLNVSRTQSRVTSGFVPVTLFSEVASPWTVIFRTRVVVAVVILACLCGRPSWRSAAVAPPSPCRPRRPRQPANGPRSSSAAIPCARTTGAPRRSVRATGTPVRWAWCRTGAGVVRWACAAWARRPSATRPTGRAPTTWSASRR